MGNFLLRKRLIVIYTQLIYNSLVELESEKLKGTYAFENIESP